MLKSIFKMWLSLLVAVIGLVGATEVAAQTGFGISPTTNLLKRAGSVVTLINNAWTLGDSSNRIAAVYTSLLDATSLSLGGTVAGDLTVGGNATIYGSSGATAPKFTATSTELGLQVDGRSLLTGNVTTTAGLTPATANTGAIGTDAYPFATARFGTSLAVPAITVTSTGAGITLYNTTDQVTNYERTTLAYAANQMILQTENAGTGSGRDLVLRSNNASSGATSITLRRSSLPLMAVGHSVSATGAGNYYTFSSTFSASSGDQKMLALTPTINQSGTAGYTALLINPTQTATGSGEKLLADFQVGGTSQLKIDNAGKLYAGGSYGGLAEGDGYYFGDEVRGLRFLTGDDFEFQNWHVGGQFYMSVYNGSARTRFAVFDAPTKRSAFSSSVDLRNYTPNTDLEVIGTASATKYVVGLGSTSDASLQFWGDADTGVFSSAANSVSLLAGGLSAVWNGSAFSAGSNNTRDLGTTSLNWRDGYFGRTVSTTNLIASGNGSFSGQVSSTSLIASATGTIGYLGLGNQQSHSFNNAILNIKHTPSIAEAATLDYIQMVNTSSTRDMAISFLDDTEMSSILRISAFGRNYASGDFGFSPANMAFIETTSGTIMLAGDGIAVFNAVGVFRPITGIGFGNNDNIDPFNATASTTISNGNMASASFDFPNSAAAGTQDLTITVNGAADGDECQIGVPNALASRASEAFTCFVSAANTITVRRTCVAGAGCGDPGAATVKAGFFSRQ